jgi:hypothetical protein
MNKLGAFLVLAVLALAPCVAQSQSNPMAVGVGPHGYDFLIGTWSCTNSMPSRMGGPSSTTLTFARSAAGSISVHVTGTNFDALGYAGYTAKTKTWWNPSAVGNGDYSTESSQQTGKKTVWTGQYFDGSTGKATPIRDTYTIDSLSVYKDLSEARIGGTWKTQAKTTCTKS